MHELAFFFKNYMKKKKIIFLMFYVPFGVFALLLCCSIVRVGHFSIKFPRLFENSSVSDFLFLSFLRAANAIGDIFGALLNMHFCSYLMNKISKIILMLSFSLLCLFLLVFI